MSKTRMVQSLSVVQLLALVLSGPALAQSAGESESAKLPIIGGVEESGFPAVGALGAMQVGLGYAAPFCSSTILAPQWVLTAAHCVTPLPSEGFYPTALLTVFVLGNDARPLAAGAGPMNGTMYRVDKLIPHPKYDPQKTENDIALVHLAEPIEGVEPIAFNTESLPVSLKGQPLLYVGFGVTDGVSQVGAGVKRSVQVAVKSIADKTYMSYSSDTGVCFGDSGGPGLWKQEDGTYRVAGVNSTVFNMTSSDPCGGNSIQTRVDIFSAWVNNYLISPAPSCKADPGMCRCAESCGEDGTCDDSKCEWYNCYRTWTCYQACASDDTDCKQACYFRGTPEAQERLHPMGWCKVTMCANQTGEQADVCLLNSCPEKAAACMPSSVGVGDCRGVGECMQGCAMEDEDCQIACYEKGTLAAREQYNQLWDCANAQCGERPVYSPFDSCVWDKCGTLMNQCFAPFECSLVTGGCPAGTACAVTPTGRFDCFPTQGLALGEGCQPDSGLVECDDGLSCVSTELATSAAHKAAEAFPMPENSCLRTCAQNSQCPSGDKCETDPFPELGGLGVCVCIDADKDGLCMNSDCDDSDPAIPAVEEVCGDQQDNNCNGEVDEGCAVVEPETPDEEGSSGGCTATATPQVTGSLLLLLAGMALVARRRSLARQ